MKFHLVDTATIFVDATHVKACANSKKMRKRVATQEALWYEESLKKEIDKDRKGHNKKPLKNNDNDKNPPTGGGGGFKEFRRKNPGKCKNTKNVV